MKPLSQKRSYLLLLSPILITLLALLLVACGVGETNAPSETTETTSLIEETTAPDPSPEETDSEEASTEETLAEETSTEETSTEETNTEETNTEETSAEETSTEETSTEETSTKETSAEETSTEETNTEETSAEETSAEETSTEETSTEETNTEETNTEETSTEETSAEETSTEETSAEETIVEETTTESSTEEDPSSCINIPTDGAHVTFFESTKPRPTTIFNYAHHAEFALVMDPTYGSVLKLTTAEDAYDPYVTFNYAAYMRGLGLDGIDADDCKYVVITLRGENCSCNSFELYYYAGSVEDATPGYQITATFDATNDGWQRIVFDLSSADWEGDVNGFRLDFLTTPVGEGESVYIYSIDFFKTAAEAYGDRN